MLDILFTAQIFLVLLLIISSLLQKSASDGTANLTSSGRGVNSRNFKLSGIGKFTLLLGLSILVNSLLIARITYQQHSQAKSVLQSISVEQPQEKDANLPPRADT